MVRNGGVPVVRVIRVGIGISTLTLVCIVTLVLVRKKPNVTVFYEILKQNFKS